MAIAPQRPRERPLPRSLRTRRQRAAAAAAASGVAIVAALVLVYAAVLGPASAGTPPLLAGFEARSYAPGQVALLDIGGGTTNRITLQLFLAGGAAVPSAAAHGWDKVTFGKPMSAPQLVRRPSGGPWLVHVPLNSTWPSGDYVARLTWHGHTDYAPFILRSSGLGSAPVLL